MKLKRQGGQEYSYFQQIPFSEFPAYERKPANLCTIRTEKGKQKLLPCSL